MPNKYGQAKVVVTYTSHGEEFVVEADDAEVVLEDERLEIDSYYPGIFDAKEAFDIKMKMTARFDKYRLTTSEKEKVEPLIVEQCFRFKLDSVTMEDLEDARKRAGAPAGAKVTITPVSKDTPVPNYVSYNQITIGKSGLTIKEESWVTLTWMTEV